MKIGILFGGQGSQVVGMGKTFYDEFLNFKKIFNLLSDEEREIAFNGSIEELSKTVNTQPILLAFSMGIYSELKEAGLEVESVAGLSLGEYAALWAAEVLDTQEALDLIRFRAKKMSEAAEGIDAAMLAVLNLDRQILEVCCKEASDEEGVVQITNLNCPGQIVISGYRKSVERAGNLAIEKGARRVVALNVSGPFHTSYMKPAAKALEERFKKIDFKPMKIPVIFNCLGREKTDEEDIKQLLKKQVETGVRMEESIESMIAKGVDTIIEIAPSKNFASFVKKIDRNIDVITITNSNELREFLQKIEG